MQQTTITDFLKVKHWLTMILVHSVTTCGLTSLWSRCYWVTIVILTCGTCFVDSQWLCLAMLPRKWLYWSSDISNKSPRSSEVWYTCNWGSTVVIYWYLLMNKHIESLFRSASASVPGASNKLGEWVSEQLSTQYVIFLHGLTQQWRPRKKRNLAQR